MTRLGLCVDSGNGGGDEMRRMKPVCARSLAAHISIYQCAIIEMARLAAGCWRGRKHDDRRHLAPEPRGRLMLKQTSCRRGRGCARLLHLDTDRGC